MLPSHPPQLLPHALLLNPARCAAAAAPDSHACACWCWVLCDCDGPGRLDVSQHCWGDARQEVTRHHAGCVHTHIQCQRRHTHTHVVSVSYVASHALPRVSTHTAVGVEAESQALGLADCALLQRLTHCGLPPPPCTEPSFVCLQRCALLPVHTHTTVCLDVPRA